MEDPADDPICDVWLLGFRESDQRPESALARVFAIEPAQARRLLATMPGPVKRGIATSAAEPLLQALRGIGARVALVPSGASQPPVSSQPPAPRAPVAPTPASSPAVAPPRPPLSATGGLGDIDAMDLDFGSGPSVPSKPPPRAQSGHSGLKPLAATGLEPIDAPALHSQPPSGPKPIEFLEAQPLPEAPAPAPERSPLVPRLIGAAAAAAGGVALFVAAGLAGSAFGEDPNLVGVAAAAGAIAVLLFGVQMLVGTLFFDTAPAAAPAIALGLVLGSSIGATGYALHRVDPIEQARLKREATMQAIREGRMPEARTFLTSADARLQGMDRPAADALVQRLYAAGARQVYVVVDYDASPDLGEAIAITMPVTAGRRQAVTAALRTQVPGATPSDGEWWLVTLP